MVSYTHPTLLPILLPYTLIFVSVLNDMQFDVLCFSGRKQSRDFHFCDCMGRTETLVRLGFWPVTPITPSTAIDMRLMDRARSFLLEGPVALRKFCSATIDHCEILPHYGHTFNVKSKVRPCLDFLYVYMSTCQNECLHFSHIKGSAD